MTALDSGHVSLSESAFEMQSGLQGLFNKIAMRCEERGLVFSQQFDDSVPDHCTVDAKKLTQLLDILLDNAVKFTHEGGVRLILTRR